MWDVQKIIKKKQQQQNDPYILRTFREKSFIFSLLHLWLYVYVITAGIDIEPRTFT